MAAVLYLPLRASAQSQPPRDSSRAADSLSLDSLRARLTRAEAAIAVLREQVAGESESSVHTRSRVRVDLSAHVLTNAFWNSGRVNNEDVPGVVLPPASGDPAPPRSSFGMSLRQTRLGAATSITDVLGGTFAGDLDVDFFGGVQNGAGDRRLFPEPRLRTVRARLIWSKTEVMFGTDTPLISDLNPLSLAAVGTPLFSAAGNLWNWLPQVRVTRDLARASLGGTPVSWGVQAAVMSPYAAQTAPGEADAVDAGDRSARPAVEARLRMRWGDDPDATISEGLMGAPGGEIGVGMHRGWVAVYEGNLLESHAVSVDGHMVIVKGIELRGEGYVGTLLRGLGGGGIAQNYGIAAPGAPAGSLGAALQDAAGWAQINVQPHPLLLGGVGCGVDLVDRASNPTRLQNTVCAGNIAWRPAQPIVIGLEYRHIATRYSAATYGSDHLNLAFGFEL